MKSAFQEFNQIDGQIENCYHEAAVRMQLSDSVLWILYMIVTNEDDREPISQTKLIRSTGMSKTTVNSALKKMEREGILMLSQGNGRNTYVSLTEQGKKLAENTVCRLVDVENRIFESWTKEEQAMMLHLNRDYAEKLAELIKTL